MNASRRLFRWDAKTPRDTRIELTQAATTFNLSNMLSVDVYQQHLNKVSRSFAFCIARLDLPLKAWVGLTYLLCRILDTIEDASWDSTVVQQKQFEAFDQFLKGEIESSDLQKWKASFPASLPEGELELIKDSARIFNDLNGQHLFESGHPVSAKEDHSGTIRSIIQQLGQSMSAGMQHFSRRKENGQLKLRSLTEVNQYCFFVAGLVGEALARLLAQVEPKFRLVEQRVLEAHHFGLFLQKVNLLKDQIGDEKEGRFLIPDRKGVLDSAKLNAQGAFRFLSSLPQSQKNFRLFCAWSLFLGLGTLAVGERAYRKGKSAKLDRKDGEKLLAEVEKNIDNPLKLEELFIELGSVAGLELDGWETTQSPSQLACIPENDRWLTDIYDGGLAQDHLKNLGLVAAC